MQIHLIENHLKRIKMKYKYLFIICLLLFSSQFSMAKSTVDTFIDTILLLAPMTIGIAIFFLPICIIFALIAKIFDFITKPSKQELKKKRERLEQEVLQQEQQKQQEQQEQQKQQKKGKLIELTEQKKLLQEKLNNHLYQLSDTVSIGRAYERYIGYLYEQNYWQVTFNGCIEGSNDNGIDLICQKGNEIHLIQAKNWSKKISKKVVHQLFGSLTEYKLKINNSNINIIGVIFTTNGADNNAMQVAEQLNIEIKTGKLDKNYPLIKYKKSTNEYYLPPEIDPLNELNYQYDKLNIDFSSGDTYCQIIQQAEVLKQQI